MSFLLRKVEDVRTISKSQSLTSVSIKDCTLRVPNETTALFLLRVIIKAIFIQDAESGKKVEVHQDLTYRPLDVRCLADCGLKEPLLATFVVGLSRVSADGCQEFSPNLMVHCNSGLYKHGAPSSQVQGPCLDMSKTFLPCRFAGKDTFT